MTVRRIEVCCCLPFVDTILRKQILYALFALKRTSITTISVNQLPFRRRLLLDVAVDLVFAVAVAVAVGFGFVLRRFFTRPSAPSSGSDGRPIDAKCWPIACAVENSCLSETGFGTAAAAAFSSCLRFLL